MKILVACEFSQVVTEAFTKKGHNVISCDFLPAEKNYPHYQGDVMDIINDDWDMMIAHPPCRYLAVSGAQYWIRRKQEQECALEFVKMLLNADIERICLENPVGKISTAIRKPNQYIQPYEHGHRISKKTGLWLKKLPPLKPTNIVEVEWVYYKNGGRCSPGHYKTAFDKDRSKLRSITHQGIANAMADQWG